jgi:hypothetical protein
MTTPDDDDLLEGHAGDPDADPAAVDPDHTPDPDYRELGDALPDLDR